jgi:integrase
MPRRSKGPRLWFRSARDDRPGRWFILDGNSQRGTGLGSGASAKSKEQALSAYLAEKHTTGVTNGTRDPSAILVDDVLALYVRDIVGGHARPDETLARIRYLRAYFGGRTLDQVTGPTCRAYAKQRSTAAAARRELEDLRSAINYHRTEGLHDKIVSVVLPPRAPARERWLTRDEAAHLIRSAWRYRERQNQRATDRHTRRHVARFMVVARYMGSRASVICAASIDPKRPPGKPWVDLATGVFHGRPVGQLETKKRRQTVRVPDALLAHMRRWRARGQRYVVQWNGRPVGRIDKAHAAAVADAGLGPEVTPHTWRHSLATWLMQAGTNPADAADYLGMTVETLLRTYRHQRPDHSAGVHAALRVGGRQRFANDTSPL